MSLTPEQIVDMVVKLKVAGFETIEITPDGGVKVAGQTEVQMLKNSYVPEMKAEEIMKPFSAMDDLSDEEILYYATPYYDELMAKKEVRTQQLKDEGKIRNG